MKKEELKQLIREIIREIGEEPINPNPISTQPNPLDGQSNNVAASRVNKILHSASQGMFSDNSWEAMNYPPAKAGGFPPQ